MHSFDYDGTRYDRWSSRTVVANIATGIANAEVATMAMDSNGELWVAMEAGLKVAVYHAESPYTTAKFAGNAVIDDLAANDLDSDDIAVVVAIPGGSTPAIGVLWGDQSGAGSIADPWEFGFRLHEDGAAGFTSTYWGTDELAAFDKTCDGVAVANRGKFADDHINAVADKNGYLYAAVKTGWDDNDCERIVVLVRQPGGNGGTWDWEDAIQVPNTDENTRPIVTIRENPDAATESAPESIQVTYGTEADGGENINLQRADISYTAGPDHPTFTWGATADILTLIPKSGTDEFNNPTSLKGPWNEDLLILAARDDGSSTAVHGRLYGPYESKNSVAIGAGTGSVIESENTSPAVSTVGVTPTLLTISFWVKPPIEANLTGEHFFWIANQDSYPFMGSSFLDVRPDISQRTTEVDQLVDRFEYRALEADLVNGDFHSNYGDDDELDTGTMEADRTWHHIVVLFEPNYFDVVPTLYVNGSLATYNNEVNTGKVSSIYLPNSDNDLMSMIHEGIYDDLTIWTRALSAAEISDIYNSGVPRDLTRSFEDYTPDDLVGYWLMGDGQDSADTLITDHGDANKTTDDPNEITVPSSSIGTVVP